MKIIATMLIVAMLGFVYTLAVMVYTVTAFSFGCDNSVTFTFENKQYQCYQIKPEPTSKENVT